MINEWIEDKSPDELDREIGLIGASAFMGVLNNAEAIKMVHDIINGGEINLHMMGCLLQYITQARVSAAQILELTKDPIHRMEPGEVEKLHRELSEDRDGE